MIKKIDNVDINYINYGNKDGANVVLLHGWGQNIEMMRPLGDGLEKDYHITIIDLPGFGNSEEPKEPWTLNEYVEAIHKLFKQLNIENPVLVGHSFGGKISLLYSSKYNVKKLVVLASPFTKDIKKLSFKTKVLKQLKKIPGLSGVAETFKKYIGSTDYKNASPIMRSILTIHVNTDLTEDVKKIKAPTLIIWGTQDEAVNIDKAYLLETLIKDAGVVIYEGCTHYAYLERLGQTVSVLNNFFS